MATVTAGGEDDDGFAGALARAQAGEPRAFDELVRLMDRPLVGFLRARGAWDPEGMANEVLVRVFTGIGRFEGGRAQFRAWTFRIARNVLVDEHRHRSRRPDQVPTIDHELPEATQDPDPMARVGERERVEALLTSLTDEQREVILLRIVAGLNIAETARAVGRREGAVRALQHRALARLRSSLSGRS